VWSSSLIFLSWHLVIGNVGLFQVFGQGDRVLFVGLPTIPQSLCDSEDEKWEFSSLLKKK